MRKQLLLRLTWVILVGGIAEAADPNLVSHWRLDEGIRLTAYDSAGSHNAAIYGAEWTSDGKYGGALVFDGDDYARAGNLGITGDWTITFWANSSNNTGNVYYPIGLSYPYAGIIMGGVHTSVIQRISIYDGTALLRGKTAITTGTWYHVAITKKGADYSIYVHGAHEKTGPLNDINLTDFKIAVRSDMFGYFKGTIDDIGVWNRALTLGDVEDPEPGTINYVITNGVSGPGYGVAWNPRPFIEQTGVANDVELKWRPGECTTEVDEHRVYLSTNFDGVNQGTVPCVRVAEPTYAPGVLVLNVTYYWRVDEVVGSDLWKGRVWSFTVRPETASGPDPSNNAVQVSSENGLIWIPGGWAAEVNGHDVYFGTNFSDVRNGRQILVADRNGDKQVNFTDLSVLFEQWLGYIEGSEPQADLNSDKDVDLVDLAVMAREWKASTAYQGRQTANRYDPGNLEFGTTYFWRIDECNEPNMWPGEVWSFTAGIDEPTLSNASAYQITQTYEGSDQAIHPDVVYFADGWRGYKYWMMMTPYACGSARAEDPSVLVGNDGFCWEVPPGLTNPIIYPPSPSGHNADPDVVYNDDTDELWVYFLRHWTDTRLVKLALMKSADGVNWSPPEYLLTWDRNVKDNERSYAIIKQGPDWHYWAQCSNARHSVYYRHSTDGARWSDAQSIVFSPVPEILPWHLDVIYVPDKSEYWMLFNCPPGKSGRLFLAKSRDKLNWTPGLNEILSPSALRWDNDILYRATLLYDSGAQLLRIWYSAANTLCEWHIGYTQTEY